MYQIERLKRVKSRFLKYINFKNKLSYISNGKTINNLQANLKLNSHFT